MKDFDAEGECYCQRSSDTETCFIYTLAEGGDCGDILNEYQSLLAACVAFGVISFLLATTISCCSCVWCGSTSEISRVAVDAPRPVAAVMSVGARDPWAPEPATASATVIANHSEPAVVVVHPSDANAKEDPRNRPIVVEATSVFAGNNY